MGVELQSEKKLRQKSLKIVYIEEATKANVSFYD